jgi:protein-disulfide isomerase
VLQRILDEYRDQVKLIYKNYPISKLHPEAREAAAAAVAAGRQGKFWQMHDRLFANQDPSPRRTWRATRRSSSST